MIIFLHSLKEHRSTDFLVTNRTIRSTDFKVVDILTSFLEVSLFRQTVTYRERGEEAPLAVAGELAGSVNTTIELYEIDTLIVVVDTAEETYRTIVCMVAARNVEAGGIVRKVHLRHVYVHEVRTVNHDIFLLILIQVSTYHYVEVVVLGEGAVVVEVSVHHVALVGAGTLRKRGTVTRAIGLRSRVFTKHTPRIIYSIRKIY